MSFVLLSEMFGLEVSHYEKEIIRSYTMIQSNRMLKEKLKTISEETLRDLEANVEKDQSDEPAHRENSFWIIH